jgi:hypothetical protein
MGSFTFTQWIIVAVIVFIIYMATRSSSPASRGKVTPTGGMICPNCGTRGNPKLITQGSIAIELILWLCFLIPGLIYSIWRLSSRKQGCPACGQIGMIGVTTPNGQLLMAKFSSSVK